MQALYSLLGVDFPSHLPVFDCRGDTLEKDPSGQVTVYSSEKAAYHLGLRSFEKGFYHDTTPIGTTGHDAKALRGLLEDAAKMLAKWEACGSPDNVDAGFGGSGVSRPIAICLANYGACILADRREDRVMYFRD